MKITVVSSYPEEGLVQGKKTVGVAWYTKSTLLSALNHNKNLEFEVWAEIFTKKREYDDAGVHVRRMWKRGDLRSVNGLFRHLAHIDTGKIVIPFEMRMFGNLLHASVALGNMIILKLKGKEITLILHQVVSEIGIFEKNIFKKAFFAFTRKLFYCLAVFASGRVIVFEKELKKRLSNNNKIKVIPLATEVKPIPSRVEAREKLGLDLSKKYVFYFGFLAPYKGLVNFLDLWQGYENVDFIMAGGKNPNHAGDPEYEAFVVELMQKAKEKDIIAPGFLPEEEVQLFYAAADLVVLPYLTFMSSSGPLALCFTFERAFLLSEALKPYFESDDIKEELEKSNIDPKNITLSFNDNLKAKLDWVFNNENKLEEFSKLMKGRRSWDRIGKEYADLFS